MSLGEYVDWRSVAYAVIALGGLVFFALGAAPVLEALSYAPLVVVALAGVLVPVRERVPEHDRLLGVGLGIVGGYGLAANGLSVLDALFALAGIAAVASVAHERATGRSARVT